MRKLSATPWPMLSWTPSKPPPPSRNPKNWRSPRGPRRSQTQPVSFSGRNGEFRRQIARLPASLCCQIAASLLPRFTCIRWSRGYGILRCPDSLHPLVPRLRHPSCRDSLHPFGGRLRHPSLPRFPAPVGCEVTASFVGEIPCIRWFPAPLAELEPPKAAEFISPARKRWVNVNMEKAPEGRQPGPADNQPTSSPDTILPS